MDAKIEQPFIYPTGTVIKMVIGGFFVVLGVLLTIQNFELADVGPVLRLWPVVLVLIGLLKYFAKSGAGFGVVLTVLGLWMLARNFGLVHFTLFQLWPLILIGAGVLMVRRAFGWQPRFENASSDSAWAVLSSRNIVVTTRDFERADAFAFVGGCRLDLTQAAMSRRPAVVDATAIWGGVEILVPDDWEVIGEVVPVMGGFEMRCESSVSPVNGQLIVRGVAVMGGIEVKSVRRTS